MSSVGLPIRAQAVGAVAPSMGISSQPFLRCDDAVADEGKQATCSSSGRGGAVASRSSAWPRCWEGCGQVLGALRGCADVDCVASTARRPPIRAVAAPDASRPRSSRPFPERWFGAAAAPAFAQLQLGLATFGAPRPATQPAGRAPPRGIGSKQCTAPPSAGGEAPLPSAHSATSIQFGGEHHELD